jgi:hypothetical protein
MNICNFLLQNGLEDGDVSSLLLFNSALQYSITKVQKNQVGLKLVWRCDLLAYAEDVNLLGDNVHAILLRRLV